MKILFLLREKSSYGDDYSVLESGLLNSARMTKNALIKEFGLQAQMKVCVDGNSINREIHLYRPKIVIIEAIWVTPKKIAELVKLWPGVHFIIRIHSETPFLANEGNSVQWCKEYSVIPNTYVAFNSSRTSRDFNNILKEQFYYLPNIYEDLDIHYRFGLFERKQRVPRVIDIGCFGAIRPMKNQLQQAIAAMRFANKKDSTLFFHMNTPRVEQEGQSVLKNIRALFKDTRHVFVEHPWLQREEFLELIDTMDCGMQVSLNESFNIVTADFVKQEVPIVVSDTIGWMPEITKVSTEETEEIVKGLDMAFSYPKTFTRTSKKALQKYNESAIKRWGNFLYD